MEVTLGFAFLTGLVSFISPSVLPLVPAYVSYLGGRAVSASQGKLKVNKFDTFTHGMAFVLGFSFVFVVIGMATIYLGPLLISLRPWLAKIGGAAICLFGAYMAKVFPVKWLEYDLRPQNNLDLQRSYLSSALIGVFFSIGWAPYAEPVLSAIQGNPGIPINIAQSLQLLVAYATGLAIPFLAAAFGVSWAPLAFRKNPKIRHYLEVGMGWILVAAGVLLFFGVFELLAGSSGSINFGK